MENIAENSPGKVVKGCCGGNIARAAKDQRRHEIFDGASRKATSGKINDDGDSSADKEEPKETRIDLAGGEDPLRPDKSPDDRCREEDFATRTGEMLGLMWRADIVDVGEGKVDDSNLYKGCKCRSHNLGHEHCPWRYFHIMTELEI